MGSEQSQANKLLPDGSAAASGTRWRIRFKKAGDLRFVSHHDLMHVFERMFRRAGLAVRTTQGFNPRPHMVFALSLALGIAGHAEVLELELNESRSAEDIQARLAAQAPAGLEILSVQQLEGRTKALVRRAFYRVSGLAIHPQWLDLPRRIDELLAAPELWIDRTRPRPRRFDIRPYLSELHLQEDDLSMALWVTPTGGARPEEVLLLLGFHEVVEAGVMVERTALELHDEVSGSAEPGVFPGQVLPQPADNARPSPCSGPVPEAAPRRKKPPGRRR